MFYQQTTDGFDWLDDHVQEAQFNCVNDAIRSTNVTVEEDADPSEVRAQLQSAVEQNVMAVTTNVCPNQCTGGNGECVNSVCECTGGMSFRDCFRDLICLDFEFYTKLRVRHALK